MQFSVNVSFLLLVFTVLKAEASPLGDPSLLARYNGVSHASRSLTLRSELNPPPACGTPTPITSAPGPGSSSVSQVSPVSESDWYSLCGASGGDEDLCGELGEIGWGYALSASADPCLQQNIADGMIFYAKGSGIHNSDDIISYATSFYQLPGEAVSVLGVTPSNLYCMVPPANSELSGIAPSQPSGVHPGLYGSPTTPLVPFGSYGTCPQGNTADVDTCSCVPSSNSTSLSAPPSDTDSLTNGTLTDSASSLNGTDTTSNSTLSDTDSSLNGTDTGSLTDDSSLNSTDTSSNATLTDDSSLNSTDTSSNATLTGTSSANSTASTSASANSTDTSSNSTGTATAVTGAASSTSTITPASAAGIIASSVPVTSAAAPASTAVTARNARRGWASRR